MDISHYEHAAVAFTLGALSDLALREFALWIAKWPTTKGMVIAELMGMYFKSLSRERAAIYGGTGGLAIFLIHWMLPNASIPETLIIATVISALQYLTVMYASLERKYPMLKMPIALVHFALSVTVAALTISGIIEVSGNLQWP